MNNEQKQQIKELVEKSLQIAIKHWKKEGHKLRKFEASRSSDGMLDLEEMTSSNEHRTTPYPNVPIVKEGEGIVNDYIAIVVDMRDSSKHLEEDISAKKHQGIDEADSEIQRIQRVFYETYALLPACEMTLSYHNVVTAEYLGDGILGFLEAKNNNSCYDALNAARAVMNEALPIVNEVLKKDFDLKPLSIGIGMAYSSALISLVGISGKEHPKAFGPCVFRATKLSNENNIILIDKHLKNFWPKSKSGSIQFTLKSIGEIEAFIIQNQSVTNAG